MPEVIATFVAQPKIRTSLLSAFGLVALALAALGVFGVLSYSVASRMREFGVRAALGASPRSIGKMILLEGLMLGSVGLVAGLIAAAALVRFLRSELYGVAAYDPATFLSSIAILLSVAVLACYLPARRAMAVDPIVALRVE
jgi:putative ABC transport system permease protein